MHVYGEISGRLSIEGQLSGRLAAEGQLAGELTIPAQILPPAYAGAYTFTPTEETQTAATADLMLTDDITIEPIPEEYIIPAGSTNINQNGTHDVTEYAEAIVNVQPALQAKAVTIDSAGTETVTPGSGYYGLSEVDVTVPGGQILRMTGLTTYPEISISDDGLIRAFVNDALTVFPVSEAGWLEAEQDGTTVYIAVDEYKQLPVQAGATVAPSESQQVAVPKGKWTTGAVNVGAIPSNYIGSGIYRADADDVVFYENDLEVVVADGYYDEVVVKTIPSGTAGTPVATKGAVSNHAIAITPSVTNSTGYITGGTKTGTPVSVSAAELVSGTYTVDSSGTKDVTNYASVSVPSGLQGSTYANVYYDGQFADIDFAVRLDGGWFDTDYYGGVISYHAIPAQTTITPSESQQTIGGPDYMMEDAVTIAAIPSSYVGSGITRRDSTHLSASGATISVPSGYYENNASKAVASGTEGTPTATKGAVNNHAITVTPSVTNAAGYISGGTHNGTGVNVSASELVSGTKSITANGTGIDVTNYAEVDVAVPSSAPALQAKSKTYTPTTSQQSETISADNGYDGLSAVNITVNAIPGEYIIPTGNKAITAAGNDIDVAAYATVSVAAGSAGTPSATKGAVSNHAIQITPSVVNTAGYIAGGTKTGTAVTVQASELVSGSETKTANGTYDVTNLAELIVNVSGGGGSSNWTLLGTKDCGTISTSSTTAATINKDFTVSDVGDYDLLVVETSVNTKTNGRHAATARLIWLTASSAIGTKNGATIATATWNAKLSSTGTATSRASTTPRGVYPYSCTLSTSGGVTSAAIVMYSCYNSTQTGTINGAYTARVYGVKLYDLIGG